MFARVKVQNVAKYSIVNRQKLTKTSKFCQSWKISGKSGHTFLSFGSSDLSNRLRENFGANFDRIRKIRELTFPHPADRRMKLE